MKRTLVIGYGNPLRGDDGAGPEVARAVMALRLPGVEVIEAHQLLPEHAEAMSHYDRVILVDASVAPGLSGVSGERIEATVGAAGDPHVSDPGALLGLAKRLFKGDAEAWLIQLPGEDFALGEQFSAAVQKAVPQAVEMIRGLCEAALEGGRGHG